MFDKLQGIACIFISRDTGLLSNFIDKIIPLDPPSQCLLEQIIFQLFHRKRKSTQSSNLNREAEWLNK